MAAALVCLTAAPASAKPKSPATADDDRARAAKEAAALSQVAATKNDAGEFKLCAEFYLQAFRTDPAFLAYLFGAARCEHKAADFEAAERDYRIFLQRAPLDDAYVGKAQAFLLEVQNARKAAASESKPADAKPLGTPTTTAASEQAGVTVATPTPSPTSTVRYGAWATVAVGVAGLTYGAVALAGGLGRKADLQTALNHGDGLITGLTWQDAVARDEAWRRDVTVGGALLGVGAAVVGTGLFLAWRTPAELALSPTVGGAQLVGRF